MSKTKTKRSDQPEADVAPAQFPFDLAAAGDQAELTPMQSALASPTIGQPPPETPVTIGELRRTLEALEAEKDISPEASATPSILVELPIGEPAPESYRFRHLNLHLDAEQAETLRRLFEGCVGKRFITGRPVTSAADVVRYWLDETRRQNPQA